MNGSMTQNSIPGAIESKQPGISNNCSVPRIIEVSSQNRLIARRKIRVALDSNERLD